jgi:hypothetical protein
MLGKKREKKVIYWWIKEINKYVKEKTPSECWFMLNIVSSIQSIDNLVWLIKQLSKNVKNDNNALFANLILKHSDKATKGYRKRGFDKIIYYVFKKSIGCR